MAILCMWTGAALFIATQRYLRGPSLEPSLALSWGGALAATGVTAAIWALLTPVCLRAALRWRPRRGVFLRNLGLLAAAGAAASLVHLLITTAFWSVADPAGRGPDFLGTVMATLAFGGAARLATFFAIAGVAWGVDDFRSYRDTLKLRLQPGFLFDTLSTLLPLIRSLGRRPRPAPRIGPTGQALAALRVPRAARAGRIEDRCTPDAASG